jgi:flavin reductase (DIM6/NTAB) family NADH-FMN oxidoreductase RutF
MRQPVPLDRCTRLLNHGPTVLVSAESGGRRNVMAAAWSMPLDFLPPKVAVVLDKQTFTRTLIESSGHFVLAVPPVALAELTTRVGGTSGRDADKFEAGLASAEPGPVTGAPLIDGCIAWLECRLLPEPHIQQTYDLFLGEVVAAWADDRVFRDGRWHFDGADESLRSIHHVAGGHYFAIGDEVGKTDSTPSTGD